MLGTHNHGTLNNWRPYNDPECSLSYHSPQGKQMYHSSYFVGSDNMWNSELTSKKLKRCSSKNTLACEPDKMKLEDISLAVDLELQAKLYRGIREAIMLAQTLISRKKQAGVTFSKREEIGMFVTLLRGESFHQLSANWYTQDKYSSTDNEKIRRIISSIRNNLFETRNWSDVGIFKPRYWSNTVANAEHWGAKALKELAEEEMNANEEMNEMKKSLVAMDVAIKDVDVINSKASKVIDGLYEVVENLAGV